MWYSRGIQCDYYIKKCEIVSHSPVLPRDFFTMNVFVSFPASVQVSVCY